jgi:hypothetical protein
MTKVMRTKKEREADKRRRSNARARWKASERTIAALLNKTLSDVGEFKPIERIPILGREGPDLTVNESGLVVNVKSRLEIPTSLFPQPFHILFCGDLVIFRLTEIEFLYSAVMDPAPIAPSKMLMDWWELMEKWTREFEPERGISAIILHRPRMPYGDVAVVIHFNDLRRIQCQITMKTPKSS